MFLRSSIAGPKYHEMLAYISGAAILLTALMTRGLFFNIPTSDYFIYYAKWLEALATHPGLTAFAEPFADYAPLYLYVLKAASAVPIPGFYSIKFISCCCDIVIALFACATLRRLSPGTFSSGRTFFAFSVMFSIPTVVINSSLLGQTDAVYGAAIAAAMYYIVAGRSKPAVIAFSLALSFKLQSIFFLPVLAGHLLAAGQLRQLIWVPVVFISSLIPAWLGGGEILYWLLIYVAQIQAHTRISLSAPSVFAFFYDASGSLQETLFWLGIGVAAVSGVVVMALTARASRQRASGLMLLIGVLSVLVLVFFLPRMHDRYLYVADVLSVIYALYKPRSWPIAVLIVSASSLAYLPYLSGDLPQLGALGVDERFASVLAAVGLCFVVRWVCHGQIEGAQRASPGPVQKPEAETRVIPSVAGLGAMENRGRA